MISHFIVLLSEIYDITAGNAPTAAQEVLQLAK